MKVYRVKPHQARRLGRANRSEKTRSKQQRNLAEEASRLDDVHDVLRAPNDLDDFAPALKDDVEGGGFALEHDPITGAHAYVGAARHDPLEVAVVRRREERNFGQ